MNQKNLKYYSLLCLFSLALASCSLSPKNTWDQKKQTHTAEEIQDESKKLNAFFEAKFNESLEFSPMGQTYLGKKTNYGKLDTRTPEFGEKMHQRDKEILKQLLKFNTAKLDEQTLLSYQIFKKELESEIESFKWRFHWYPVNQMFGFHSGIPSFLINMHQVETKQHAYDYISRLKEIKRFFSESMNHMRTQKEMGIMAPHFVFAKVIDDSKNIIAGRPFDRMAKMDSPLFEDFKKKLQKLKLTETESKQLISAATLALTGDVKPSYLQLISLAQELEVLAREKNYGVWSLPKGEEYYNHRLAQVTTTDMRAEEIHQIGLSEISRIHLEMKNILTQIGSKKSLMEFFSFVQKDKQFYYPDSKEGRKNYLKDTNKIITDMKAKLPEMFLTLPKADLKVKAVEKFREKSAGTAFYQGPSLFGNRPGIYYVNLYKMDVVSKYDMEALAYHEALPGHHMQIAIKTELEQLPKFRRTGGFTAYSEGWGLYSEYLPKEFGFYKDPYSDFGRLAMELWRACRLVVDTGIHAKKWSKEKAIGFLRNNTPNSELDINKAIERYFVLPAQATAYKVGMMKILELRENAKLKLGTKFDIRKFHDVVLRDGALPLKILESQVHNWVASELKVNIENADTL